MWVISHAGTINTGVTRRQDKPLKEICNIVLWKSDNPLKVMRNIVLKGTLNQWPIGLTISTYIEIKSSNKLLIWKCLTAPSLSSYHFNKLDEFSHGTNPSSIPTRENDAMTLTSNSFEGFLPDFLLTILPNMAGEPPIESLIKIHWSISGNSDSMASDIGGG